jgi:hypothetical protein
MGNFDGYSFRLAFDCLYSILRHQAAYDNQNNTLHPIERGWSHNFEGVVLEEEAAATRSSSTGRPTTSPPAR